MTGMRAMPSVRVRLSPPSNSTGGGGILAVCASQATPEGVGALPMGSRALRRPAQERWSNSEGGVPRLARPHCAPMIVTVHQPHYIPWLGYLHRMAAADLFIVLDHVQFER